MAAPISIEPAPADSDTEESRQPVDVALDAALLVIRNGGSTAVADRCFHNILGGYGQAGITAVWRLDLVTATGVNGGLNASVKPVGPIGVNLVRVSEAVMLGRRAASGETPAPYLAAEVERIGRVPSPYNRWVTALVAAATGASFSRLPGGDWGSFVIAFLAAGAGQFLRSALQARKFSVAPVMLVSALLSAVIATAALRLGYSEVKPATLIASIIYLVPGLPLINGFLDMMSHKYLLVGIERMANAAFLFLVLAIAIAFADTVVL